MILNVSGGKFGRFCFWPNSASVNFWITYFQTFGHTFRYHWASSYLLFVLFTGHRSYQKILHVTRMVYTPKLFHGTPKSNQLVKSLGMFHIFSPLIFFTQHTIQTIQSLLLVTTVFWWFFSRNRSTLRERNKWHREQYQWNSVAPVPRHCS